MLWSLLRKIHLWAGLGAGLFLRLVGTSGAILGFRDELDRALHPGLLRCVPQGPRLEISTVLDTVRRERPAEPPVLVRLPRHADDVYEITLASRHVVYLDPYRGHELGMRRGDMGFLPAVHRLHTSLLAGRVGHALVGLSTALLLGLVVTGLPLWWPRRGKIAQSFRVQWGASWRRLNRDLHTVIGFYSALVLLVLASTGLLLFGAAQVLAVLDGRSAEVTLPPAPVVAGQSLITPEAAIEAAEKALPGTATLGVGVPAGKGATYIVYKSYPEDHTPLGRTRVMIDGHDRKVLDVQSTRTAPLGRRTLILARGLHTGEALGLPGRVLVVLGSAWAGGLFVTGLLMWWSKRRSAQPAEK
jgi:uncharacterized iron-regulated membrane protein